MVSQTCQLIHSFLFGVIQKGLVARVHGTSIHKVLPYQYAFLITEFIKQIIFVNATSPNTQHVHVCRYDITQQRFIVLCCDTVLHAVLRDVISPFHIHWSTIYFKIKRLAHCVRLCNQFHRSYSVFNLFCVQNFPFVTQAYINCIQMWGSQIMWPPKYGIFYVNRNRINGLFFF